MAEPTVHPIAGLSVYAVPQRVSADSIWRGGTNDPAECEVLRKALALRLLQSSSAIVTKDDDVLRILVSRPRLDAQHSISPHIINADARKAVTGVALP